MLLVEDNEVNQLVAVAMLEKQGYDVDVVGDGQAALDAVADRPYDAVLMDCQMPVMDGYAAAAELRRREAGSDHLPIIALTAHALDAERERCFAAGMDDFVPKPVRADALAAALERHIGPPVDTARLRDAVGSDELVAQIVDLFLAQAATHVETIRHAIAANDGDAIARTAHTLKGSAATVGANAVMRAAAALERGDLTAARRLTAAVERARAAK